MTSCDSAGRPALRLKVFFLLSFCFLGNTGKGGTYTTVAFMQVTTVTSAPLSDAVRAPTCFFPRKLRTFECLCCTVVIPVSSTLNTRAGLNLIFSNAVSRRSKNASQFSSVKPCGCLLRKPFSHFFPAHALLSDKGCGDHF